MGPRDFDPIALGTAECAAWVAYYRRDWRMVLTSAVRMVRLGFGMSWPRTLRGAWFVLRANQVWAPFPTNDPDRARDFMRRFYELAARAGGLDIDPARAAELEVQWWRVHRERQRAGQGSEADLTAALTDLYAYTYSVDRPSVHDAAHGRALAMRYSDEWVAGGCEMGDPLLATERAALVASYTALLRAAQPSSSST